MRQRSVQAAQMLGALLRWKRSVLDRKAIGLPPRLGARGGLTQDDLAERTGYDIRVIRNLELDRIRTPQPDLLEAIAAALLMTPAERWQLWVLATGAMPSPSQYMSTPEPVLARLVGTVYPHPAYVTDVAWNLLAFNEGIREWFTDFSQIPPTERNIARWIFLNPHARHVFGHWQSLAAQFVARMRAVAAANQGDNMTRLVAELRDSSSDFERMWQAESAVYFDQAAETRFFRRPGHTDPAQPNDADYHAPVDMVITAPLQPGDQRRLVVFLLPEDEPHHPHVRSEIACTACHPPAR